MDVPIFFREYFTPLLALIVGLFSFKYFDFFWKLLFLQLALYVITIKIVYEITPGIQTNTNHWFYNGYVILEIFLLCFSPFFYFKTTFSKISLFILFGFYLLIFLVQGALDGFDVFLNFSFAAAGLIITLLYGSLLFTEFRNGIQEWFYSPKIWASIGLLIFFSCTIPYFSLFNYLNTYYLTESKFLYNFMIDVLANLRYFLLAFSFLLLRRNSSLPKTYLHEQ